MTWKGNTRNNLLQKQVMDSLRLESYLVFPVAIGYGLSVHFFFYSRNSNVYTKDHVALLNRVAKTCLEQVANSGGICQKPPLSKSLACHLFA